MFLLSFIQEISLCFLLVTLGNVRITMKLPQLGKTLFLFPNVAINTFLRQIMLQGEVCLGSFDLTKCDTLKRQDGEAFSRSKPSEGA